MVKHTVSILTLVWLLAFPVSALAQPSAETIPSDPCTYQPSGSGVVVTVDLAKVQAFIEEIDIPPQYLEMMPSFGPPTGVPMSPMDVVRSLGVDTTRSAVLAFYGDNVFDHAARYGEIMSLLLGEQAIEEVVPLFRSYNRLPAERQEPYAATVESLLARVTSPDRPAMETIVGARLLLPVTEPTPLLGLLQTSLALIPEVEDVAAFELEDTVVVG